MLTLADVEGKQNQFIYLIHEDDIRLLEGEGNEWFKGLHYFEWEKYCGYAARYYDGLYAFNLKATRERNRINIMKRNVQSKEEARQRLLFERATMDKTRETIYEQAVKDATPKRVNEKSVAPGVVPERVGGKKPKCFFALFKSFIGCSLMGFEPEPENVHKLLQSNPSFVRVCGFVAPRAQDEYCYEHVPSLRKLEQFDQIMMESGIWEQIKLDEVKRNIEQGIIECEKELVADTTHYYGYSNFETVEYEDAKGKKKKKSQSRMRKRCNCQDWTRCGHDWKLTDDGAGTIVKSKHKMYWGHKASVIGYPRQGVPLDAAAVSDAAVHDSRTVLPHTERLFENLPEIEDVIERVLYDSACDDKELKKAFWKQWRIELTSGFNPGAKKAVEKDLPRGMEKITPRGVPLCAQGHEMDYKGIRWEQQKFIYQAPVNNDGTSVCFGCPNRMDCCPNASLTGRTVSVSFDVLSHINPEDPPMAKRFKAIMARRPSVERMIKRLKCDLSNDRLTKRGNASFQAYLDKTMIAFHMLLRL